MKKICYIFKGGRKDRCEAVKSGEAPADFFYGAIEMERRGYEVDIVEENMSVFNHEKISVWKKVPMRWVLVFSKINPDLLDFFTNPVVLERLRASDCIVATTNSQGRVLGLLSLLGILRKDVVFIAMGMLPLGFHPWDLFISRILFSKIRIATLSKKEQVFLKRRFPSHKIGYFPFGVDEKFWFPDNEKNKEEKYVLSVGNDGHRDYETLVAAWKPEYPCLKVITRLPIKGAIPRNIEIIKGDWRGQILSDLDMREIIQKSEVVIIPLKETIQPSGQSFCLQAMACAKPIVLSKIEGLWDDTVMIDQKTCLLPPPGSAFDLQEAFEKVYSDTEYARLLGERAYTAFIDHFTIKHLVDGLENFFHAK